MTVFIIILTVISVFEIYQLCQAKQIKAIVIYVCFVIVTFAFGILCIIHPNKASIAGFTLNLLRIGDR